MADSANKTKATARPRQASTNKEAAAEVAMPTKTSREGIEPVAKVEAPKKAAAKPRKAATKKDDVIAIEQLAYQYWVQRGYKHGYALEDWLRAKKELQKRTS